MKVKTSELIGLPLDWIVAKANGDLRPCYANLVLFYNEHYSGSFRYQDEWSAGGPIIEQADISFRKYHNPKSESHGKYYAKVCQESGSMVHWSNRHNMTGPTALIASMRCFVQSKFGDEVEIPDGLLRSR